MRRGVVVVVGRRRRLLERASLAKLCLCEKEERRATQQRSNAATRERDSAEMRICGYADMRICGYASDILRVRTHGKDAHRGTLSELACCRRLLGRIQVNQSRAGMREWREGSLPRPRCGERDLSLSLLWDASASDTTLRVSAVTLRRVRC